MFYHPESQRKIPEGVAFVLDDIQYPSNWLNLSTPGDKVAHGIVDLITDAIPEYDPAAQRLITGPIIQRDGVWYETWVVNQKTAYQLLADAKAMQDAILQAMTSLFDATAQARHYDNRITCVMRAGYPGPFHAEGVAFASWMDAQNAKAYAILAQVQAGAMPMPASVSAALALLDPMVWPA